MTSSSSGTEHPSARRPNIVLIVSDDHGYADLADTLEGTGPRTPNLARLQRMGVTFTRGYVSAPICSPSRAGLIAGVHQARWGAGWFNTSSFPPAAITPGPVTLRELGYRTSYIGKVHYGPDTPGSAGCPENHGFDESFYGLAALGMGRLHYMVHSAQAAAENPEVAARHNTYPLYENGEETDCTEHLTKEFADRAVDTIRRATAEDDHDPYFCMVAFNAVHNFTWQLPQEELDRHGLPPGRDFDPSIEEYVDWYDGAIWPHLEHGREYYLAQLEYMDRHIGRILDAVEASGEAEDTIIVYLTDNGGSPCNYGDNSPLDGTKYTLYEGGVRVPFIVSWPGVAPAGTTSDALVSSLDLMPTFVAAACADGPATADRSSPAVPFDGQDLRPVLSGASRGHEALFFDTGVQQAVVRSDVKWRRVTEDGAGMREALLASEHTDIGEGESVVRFENGLAREIRASADDSSVERAGGGAEPHESCEVTAPPVDAELCARLRADFVAWQEDCRRISATLADA